MLKQLIDIICEFVEIEPEEITAASSLRNDVGATSFDLMNIAVEIERSFRIRVPDDRLPLIKTVGDIASLIESAKARV